jgi:hypothetical protein
MHPAEGESTADPAPWSLALCWKDEPRTVDVAEDTNSLVRRFERLCRECGAICLVDTLALPPARGVRSLLKPVPRVQALVSSVWRDADALRQLEPGSLASDGPDGSVLQALLLRDHVVFWTPGRAIPTLAQTEQRLARVQVMGSGALLGSLRQLPTAPPVAPEILEHPQNGEMRQQEERLRQDPRYAALQYDRRCFQAVSNTANGDVQPGLRFEYHEEDGVLWAWYEGDGVFLGSLAGRKSATGALRISYQHTNGDGELRAGQCISYPEFLPDGRLRLHEYWRWSGGDRSAGVSQIEECAGTTLARRYA